MFERIDETILFLIASVLFLAVIECSFRLGRRHRTKADEGAKRHYAAIQAALLGLLALLLGFNFAMASSRFEARKTLVQDEVNAIGTAYLRAQLLPPPQSEEFKKLLRTYLDSRLYFLRTNNSPSAQLAMNADSAKLDADLWSHVQQLSTQSPPSAFTTPFIQSINDMINLKWKRRTAYDSHVPEPVTHLLFAVTAVALGFISYSAGLAGPRRHISTSIFALLLVLVLTVTLDLDRPRGGFIRVSEDGILRLKASFDTTS